MTNRNPLTLSDEETGRYSRQLSLPGFGVEAQLRLKAASVLLIGAGGLGSPAALYLAAAGVGAVTVVDGDAVDLSNLQRQVIHTTATIGVAKAANAARAMTELNPNVRVTAIERFVTPDNIDALIAHHDFIIDATDSLTAKRLINDRCVAAGKPLSHGAIWRHAGHTMTVLPGTACFSCLFDTDPEPDSSPRGPLGVTAGIIGTLQASETIKYLTGTGTLLTNTLLSADTLTNTFTKISVAPSPHCRNRHTPVKDS